MQLHSDLEQCERVCLSLQSLHWLDRPSFLLQTERLALCGRVSWAIFKANLRQSGGSCCIRLLHPLPQGGGVYPGLFFFFFFFSHFFERNRTPSGKKTVTGVQVITTASQVQSIGCRWQALFDFVLTITEH